MLEEASSVGHVGEDVTITMVVVETSEDDGWSREIGGSVEEKKEAGQKEQGREAQEVPEVKRKKKEDEKVEVGSQAILYLKGAFWVRLVMTGYLCHVSIFSLKSLILCDG